MSKANKGGYQIIDFSSLYLIDNIVSDLWILGEIELVVSPIVNTDTSVIGYTLKDIKFSNQFVKYLYECLTASKKPKMVKGIVLHPRGYETDTINIESQFIQSPEISFVKDNFTNYGIRVNALNGDAYFIYFEVERDEYDTPLKYKITIAT